MRLVGALRASLLLVPLLLMPPGAAAEPCVSGTLTAERTNDPGFEGLWKYTLAVSWELARFDLSHLNVILALENCECVCDPRLIRFGDPAGTSTGTDGALACTVHYLGEYLCMGSPHIPSGMNGPAVKYEVDPAVACEPGLTGTGTFCFYSPMPPAPENTFVNALAVKHGQEVCFGDLSGTIPTCDCALPVSEGTWGRLKNLYR